LEFKDVLNITVGKKGCPGVAHTKNEEGGDEEYTK